MTGMRRLAHGLIPAWIAALALAAVAHGAPAERAAATPSVTVSIERGTPRLDHTKDHNLLKSMAQCRVPAVRGDYLGLTTGKFRARFTYKVRLGRQGGQVQGGLVSVHVVLSMGDRQVYVASELPKGSCSYAETRAHEMRHVQVDDDLMTLFGPRLKTAVEIAGRGLADLTGTRPADITNAIHKRLDAVLDREMRALNLMRHQRQAAVDSRDEYKRLGSACHGEAERLVKAADAGSTGWHESFDCEGLE